MANSEKRDLGYLGDDFQKRLIHALMEDSDFFREIIDIVDQNMFTNATYRTYVALIKDYFEKKEVVPSYSTMEIVINEKIKSNIDRERLIEWNKDLPNVTTEATDYIREVATRFFKQQNIVKVANEILDLAAKGDSDHYEDMVEKINKAVNVGIRDIVGEKVFDNITQTLSDDYRITIPTGIKALDAALEGGIGKGELGLIIAPSGCGKTSLTTGIAAFAAVAGFKVLQIVFEDRIKQIQRKHIGRITNIEARNISKPENREKVMEALANYKDKDALENNLRIVRFPTGEVTATYIENYLKKLINSGFKPDLCIIDYFECLVNLGDSTQTEWQKEGVTMRKFESMAQKLNMALWIPTQGNRESISSEVVTMDKSGGSLKKIQIGHIVISIARSTDDINNNRATIALLKNRAGCSGKIWNDVYFNNGTCVVDTDQGTEFGSSVTFGNRPIEKDVTKVQSELFKQLKEKKQNK